MAFKTSSPETFGRERSRKIRSGVETSAYCPCLWTYASASSPSETERKPLVKPAALNAISVRRVSAGLLSTTRISICLRVAGTSRPMEGLDTSNLLSVGQKGGWSLWTAPSTYLFHPRKARDSTSAQFEL